MAIGTDMPHEPQKRVLELVHPPPKALIEARQHLRPSPGGRDPSLREVLSILAAGRWTIAAVAAGVLALAAAYLLLAPPVYEAEVVIQVEEKARTMAGLEQVPAALGERSPAETEIEIVRSRKLLGQVVDELNLDIEAQPRRFPVVGGALARAYRGAGPAPALLGLTGFAWGGERIRLSRLDVPPSLVGGRLMLTALERGRFRLFADDDTLLAEGDVGRLADSPQARIVVDALVSRPGTVFLVRKRLRADVVDVLREDLRAEERGKKTGILVLGLGGTDPARVASTLETIAATYLRQNVEGRSAEAKQTLDFLEGQLPVLKANLDRAELALEAYQQRKGTVSLSREAEAVVARTAELEREISALELERTAAERRFTAQHPEVLSISKRIEQLRATRGVMDARLRSLPGTELDSARLSRDVKVASELYLALLNRAQELRVMRSGIVGNVSVIDPALVPSHPARPKAGLVLGLGLLLGLGAGVATALGRRAWAEGADDPREIEVATGLPVYATVPHSLGQDRLRRAARQLPGAPEPALAAASPGDVAVENLRGLRTAVHHALAEARSNVLAVSSPSTGVGKSFVCVNLAHLLAAAGWRVLLVDADLRRGRLHRHFSLDRQPGLSDVLCGFAEPQEAIRGTGAGRLDLLASGRLLPNPAELLGSQRFHQVLSRASRSYDLVILDCPPALAVTDPVLVAGCAGVNLMVLQAGQHPMEEILAALQRFTRSGVKVWGLIMNDFEPGGRGPYASDRRYEYPSEER
jgi:tyrosine-protein kinase Etk/Wzc